MNIIELANDACKLTQAAIQAAQDEDWEKSQSMILKRDQTLSELPDNFSSLAHDKQLELRVILESVDKLNSEFIIFVNSNREQLMKKKSDINKNMQAINNYLDHAIK